MNLSTLLILFEKKYNEALEMVQEIRDPGTCCVNHSDRDVQYACDDYILKLDQSGLIQYSTIITIASVSSSQYLSKAF